MHLDEATRHLGAHLRAHVAGPDQWPDLAPGGTGPRAFRLGEVVVSLHPTDDGAGFLLESALGVLPADPAAQAAWPGELLADMLATNALLSAHGAGVPSLDLQGRFFLTHRFDGEGLSCAQFLSTLERFIQRATYWQALVSRAMATAAEPALGVAA